MRPHVGSSRALFWLAYGLPLAWYLSSISPHGYWLDSGEFVAAAIHLGVTHPPGHPLAALMHHAATWVPLGSHPFRVGLAQALAAAVAAGSMYRAIAWTLRSIPAARSPWTELVALGATWWTSASFGWWFQAVRPEVYALQAALIMVAVERLTYFEWQWPSSDHRPLYVAALALGCGLGNHHFLAILAVPCVAPTAARAVLRSGVRPLVRMLAAGALPLLVYAYLPLRAVKDPLLNLGDPSNLPRLWWVVTAKAFQKNTGYHLPQPLPERFADVVVQLVGSLHFGALAMAFIGAYFLLRMAQTRRIAWLWLTICGVFVAARAWLGFVRSNPDALGYLMPALAAFGALAAAALGALGLVLSRHRNPLNKAVCATVAVVVVGLGASRFFWEYPKASLADFAATDWFTEHEWQSLPPRAVVVAHSPQTIFRIWGARGSAHVRPDVTLVPAPFITYPNLATKLARRHPELQGLAQAMLDQGQLTQSSLQSLAIQRPTFVELDPRVATSVYPTLAPAPAFHSVVAEGATEQEQAEGARTAQAHLAQLYGHLSDPRDDPETRNQLLWRHYNDAVFLAAVGLVDASRQAARQGLELNPHSKQLRALHQALQDAPEGEAIDVRPFQL